MGFRWPLRTLAGHFYSTPSVSQTRYHHENSNFLIAWFSFKCRSVRVSTAHLLYAFLVHVLKRPRKKEEEIKLLWNFSQFPKNAPGAGTLQVTRMCFPHLVLATGLWAWHCYPIPQKTEDQTKRRKLGQDQTQQAPRTQAFEAHLRFAHVFLTANSSPLWLALYDHCSPGSNGFYSCQSVS